MKRLILLLAAAILLITTGCSAIPPQNNAAAASYTQISQEKAAEMMAKDDGHVIVDVRRQDEYEEGHIPGAILIPNESIENDRPEELPDLDQIILIYCRSGRRSKEASQKLADMGYKNIYEFGGITDWTGDIVTGTAPGIASKTASLSFSSFDGGGPVFSLRFTGLEDVISYTCIKNYGTKPDEPIDGAPFDVMFSFTGLKPGETTFIIEERSPITANCDIKYSAIVDEDLNVTIKHLSTEDLDAVNPIPTLVIMTENGIFYADLEDNPSAEAFTEKLSEGAITVAAHDYGNFEKVGYLPWSLPQSDEEITTGPGDIILYQGNQITVYYDTNTWNFTKLAHIDDVTREELLDALGSGDTEITFYIEWSE